MNQVGGTLEEIIKVQPRGVITIPWRLRGEDFGENNFIRIKKTAGRLILEPVTLLGYPVRRYTDREIGEFLELDRQESKRLKKTGLLK